jgi:hypothetical protein
MRQIVTYVASLLLCASAAMADTLECPAHDSLDRLLKALRKRARGLPARSREVARQRGPRDPIDHHNIRLAETRPLSAQLVTLK